METKDFSPTFAGTGTDKKTLGAGMSFVVLSSTSVMTGKVYRKGRQIAEISLINQGDVYTAAAPFDYVELNSAGAQTVTVLLTEGQFKTGELTGRVSISNAPNIGTVAAITPPALATPYYRNSVSTSLQTLVTPAANTAGVVVYGMTGWVYSAGGYAVRIMAKTSPPASIQDAAAHTLLYVATCVGQPLGSTSQIALPVMLPSGTGLYEQSSDGTGSVVTVTYEVLL